MTDAQSWALIVGALVPFVTAIIIRRGWSQPLQAGANFVVAAIAAAGTQYFAGNFDPTTHAHGYISVFLLVLVTSIASYHGFLKPTKVATSLEAVTGGDPVDLTPADPMR